MADPYTSHCLQELMPNHVAANDAADDVPHSGDLESGDSLVLRSVQRAHVELDRQLQDLRAAMERKANAEDITTPAQVEHLVTKLTAASRAETAREDRVATHVKLKELSVALQRKADVGSVPTHAQLRAISAELRTKANAKDIPTAEHVADLAVALVSGARVAPGACLGPAAPEPEVAAMREELLAVKVRLADAAPDSWAGGWSELRKLQLVVAAAGARFERQLCEVSRRVQSLEGEPLGIGGRWPGCVLPRLSGIADHSAADLAPCRAWEPPPSTSDVDSDFGSMPVSSRTESYASSSAGMSPEERAELRRLQAVVGAAGRTFLREMRDLRRHVKELDGELLSVKKLLACLRVEAC